MVAKIIDFHDIKDVFEVDKDEFEVWVVMQFEESTARVDVVVKATIISYSPEWQGSYSPMAESESEYLGEPEGMELEIIYQDPHIMDLVYNLGLEDEVESKVYKKVKEKIKNS